MLWKNYCAPAVVVLVNIATVALADNVAFYPAINMTDTDGNLIQAHGGDIFQENGVWYWFGEDKSGETSNGNFIAVNCYSSTDFQNWSYSGAVLTPIPNTNISSSQIVERPKVLYNEKNDEYVMWFHNDQDGYTEALVGVATSKTIDGQYSYRGSFKPFGNDSRDMTLWKDPDSGTPYYLYASDWNADFVIATLDDDYYNVAESLFTFPGVYWEAPGVFKIDGIYFLIWSHTTGWTPNDGGYVTAQSMSGPWSSADTLAETGSMAYLTQNAYDITFTSGPNVTYIYYGDRWSANFLGSSSYAFYPVSHSNGAIELHPTGGWLLDTNTGTWSDIPYTAVTAEDSTSSSSSLVACSDGCSGGQTVSMTAMSNFSFTWNGSAGSKVLGIVYIYNGPDNDFRHVGVTVDGKAVPGCALLETTYGTDVSQTAAIGAYLHSGSKVVLSLLDYNGQTMNIDAVNIYEDLR